jgi:hypothetical protein
MPMISYTVPYNQGARNENRDGIGRSVLSGHLRHRLVSVEHPVVARNGSATHQPAQAPKPLCNQHARQFSDVGLVGEELDAAFL